jgi:peroxiredoxin Q/BCP
MKGLVFLLLGAAALGVAAPASAQVNVGDPAPDFTLQASDGKSYRLADFKGKQAVVIAWYPGAFTQASTLAVRSFVASANELRRFSAAYFMASVDPLDGDQGVRAFAKAEKATFPMLSDSAKKVAGAYGVLAPTGRANLWTFYVDREGRVAAIDKQVRPLYAGEDVVARLAGLKLATTN